MDTLVGSTEENAVPENETDTKPGRHAAPEGAEVHPLIDLSRDLNRGKPDHAAEAE
ncbi:MAG: hypothetical protein M3443_20760 [Actinomycetota bacterium]|nr:hypothetical protein [Actinomycetota bacterium]